MGTWRPWSRRNEGPGLQPGEARSLCRRHLAGAGIEDLPLVIAGMDHTEEFHQVFLQGRQTLDREKCRQEMVRAALDMQRGHPGLGALVLECANMPPYSGYIRRATGLPVFDAVTMINTVQATVSRD